MIVTFLVAIIIILAVIDLLAFVVLIIHHLITSEIRRFNRRAFNYWKKAITIALNTGVRKNVDYPQTWRDYRIIGKVLRSILLDTKDEKTKLKIRRTLEERGYVDYYIRRLHSRWRWIRGEAALALGETQSQRALPHLVAALDDKDLSVRQKAATALAYFGRPDMVVRMMDKLDKLGFVSIGWFKDVLYTMNKEHPEAFDRLLDTIKPLMLRKAFIEIIGEIGDYSNINRLTNILNDSSEEKEIRVSAVKTLGKLKSGTKSLREALTFEDWEIRAAAAKALGDIGDVGAIAELEKRLSDSNWWVRVNSSHALAKLGSQGLQALQRAVREKKDQFAHDISRQTLEEIKMMEKAEVLHAS